MGSHAGKGNSGECLWGSTRERRLGECLKWHGKIENQSDLFCFRWMSPKQNKSKRRNQKLSWNESCHCPHPYNFSEQETITLLLRLPIEEAAIKRTARSESLVTLCFPFFSSDGVWSWPVAKWLNHASVWFLWENFFGWLIYNHSIAAWKLKYCYSHIQSVTFTEVFDCAWS